MDDVIGLSPKLLACSVGAYPVAGTLHLRDLVGKVILAWVISETIQSAK